MTRSLTLDALPLDVPAVLVRLSVEPEHVSMLRGMGIIEGREVQVLRRAAFGGPLQVCVGEVTFALDRGVAAQLHVERLDASATERDAASTTEREAASTTEAEANRERRSTPGLNETGVVGDNGGINEMAEGT